MTTRSRAAAAAAIVLVLVQAATTLAHGPDPALSGASWAQDQRLEFRWRAGAEPTADLKSAIRAAATDSNESRASRAAVFAYDAGGSSPIGYGPGATCGVNGIACYTRSAPDGGFTMWLREHGRVFDWGVLRWCQELAVLANGCYDAETIALDEFGHIQGLGHHVNHADESDYLDAVVQTVSRTRPRAGWDMHEYGPCDVATLQIRYDVPISWAPVSACLDLVTILTLGANDLTIAYGGTVTLTATLKVANDSAYGRLAANPLTDRLVRIQRRPPGGTFQTVATMPSTSSGTYTWSTRLQADADFRAVYTASTSEGLRSDTSGTIRVDVATCSGICPQSEPGS